MTTIAAEAIRRRRASRDGARSTADDLEILHRPAGAGQCAGDRHGADRRRRAVHPAGRAVSERRAADRVGHHELSRRQRRYRDEHRGAADRAAGQRRAGHDLHAVDQRVRRHVFADRHLRDRHRPELRAGAGAEPGLRGDGVAAAVGAGAGRDRAAEIDLDPADRHADLAGRPLRQPVPQQLCHDQPGAGTFPRSRRRQRRRVRRRAVFHADLAGSADAAGARAGARRT